MFFDQTSKLRIADAFEERTDEREVDRQVKEPITISSGELIIEFVEWSTDWSMFMDLLCYPAFVEPIIDHHRNGENDKRQ